MKLPEYLKQESSHRTNNLNTLTLTGLSFLWATFLGLISPWWNILTFILLMAGYGNEISKRKQEIL